MTRTTSIVTDSKCVTTGTGGEIEIVTHPSGSLFPGAQSGTFYGAFDSEDEVSGEFGVASIITDTWEGTFTAPDTFEGTFSGSTTYSGYSLSYTGTISTQR